MSDQISDTGLLDLDHIQSCHSTDKTSSTDHQDAKVAPDGAHITPTSPTFRYPDISLPQSEPGPGQDTTGTLHPRPSALLVDQDGPTAYVSESEHDFAFQSPNVEDEDFYGNVSDTSSAPIIASSRRSELRTSPAPEDCACGVSWHSEPGEEELHGFHAGNGTPSSMQVPPAPANSPHDEQPPQATQHRTGESHHGPPCFSSEWPHYWKPTGEDKVEETIKCYDSNMRSDAEPATTLPRSQSSGWWEGKLERNKNASSGFIHANMRNIDDGKRGPVTQPGQDVDRKRGGSELQYWKQKHQEMLEEIQQVDVRQAPFGQQPALIAPDSPTSRLSEAGCMVDMMKRRGFKPTSEWLAECSGVSELARRGNTYPLMAFVIAEFGEFFSQDQELASEDHLSQELLDLDTATNKGVIDACQAVKSLMSMGRSRPTEAWCKQYDALTANAQDRGDIEPLIEFVRCKAENISLRNASERTTKAKDSLRQNYNVITLDESGTQIRSSLKNGPAVGYDDDQKGKGPEHSQRNVHQEYGIWLNRNYQSETEPFGNRFIYITNSTHPIVARLDNFETKQPFVVTLSHYFDEFRLLASVSIVALAVRVTPSKNKRSVDTYAEVWLRDSEYCERVNSPFRVEGLSTQGQLFDLDEEAIIAMIEAKLGDICQATALEDVESDSASHSYSNASSSSASGTTLRRRDSDHSQFQSPSPSRQPHIHLTPEETREMHPNVVAERGMTLVPLHDFPDLAADQYNFPHYQVAIGASSSNVFVNCERCHKTLASFENVEAEPTVARREKDEPGDTYIVTSVSSLDNIVDSVDEVKRVWLQIGTHKYFMRANEAGVERTHECISIQDTLSAAIEQEERETATGYYAAGYYTQDNEEALGYDRFGDLSSQKQRSYAQSPPLEREQDRDQRQPDQIPSVRMPSSMQFLPLHLNFPTAELTSVREPCTIISVCEQRGIIHGVYQGAIGYRAIFRGPAERGHRVYLDIRDGLGGYIGRLSRIRHYEVSLMNGQVSTFTAEEEPEERIDPMGLSRQPGQGHSMGLRGGSPPVEDWADTEADTYWSDDEEMSLRGGANVDFSDSDDDVTPGPPKEVWIQTGAKAPTSEGQQASSISASQPSNSPPKEECISAGTTSSAPKNQQTGSASASLFSDPPKEEWMPTGVSVQKQTSQQVSANAFQSNAGPKQGWYSTGVSAEQPKIERKPCTCSSRKGKEPAHAPSVPPGASTQPLMTNKGANSNDSVGPSKGKGTVRDLIHGGAPEDGPTHNQQWAGSMGHASSLESKGPVNALRDFSVGSPHQFVPSNDPPQPRVPQAGSERIPSWLQAGPQSDPDQVDSEEPVFTLSYKKWLSDISTRPSYTTCGTNPAPGPSFQDFWQDREAGRSATMADGCVLRPRGRPEGEYHGAADRGEHIRMESDDHVGSNRTEESPIVRPFGCNARHFDQAPGRRHGADVDEGEHIRLQEERPRTEEMTSLNPALQNILNRYLRGRAIHKARAASNATVKED